ncbi:glutathione S-transferase family protein [Roseiterribacter gracilis]|uniref:glutathione transferase n=1 Tax=Roseiterribacter gracilis TaxID=2812848 RepID=A0A8S8XJA7_9PROT|nr:glutathione S-transferase [Rhodospirillales bacterium TMPK1]
MTAPFIVYGIPGSPYVRKVLLGLEEKNLPWRLAALGFGEHKQPAHLARHPFGRMPVVDHGETRLYEAQAILRYLDRIAPTPALTPTDPVQEARMNQICGIVDWYVIHDISSPISFARVVAPKFGLPVDEARVQAAIPRAEICMGELSRLLGSQIFLAGDALSLADLMLAPHLDVFVATDEAQPMFARHPNLRAWLGRMQARPSMQATTWERVTALAQAA